MKRTCLLLFCLSLFACKKEEVTATTKPKKKLYAYLAEVGPDGDTLRSNVVIIK